MRSAELAHDRRTTALKILVCLVALSFIGAGMTVPSAQAWIVPVAGEASFQAA